MTAQTRRRVFIISVAAVVLIALAYGFMPKPVPVDWAKVSRGPLQVTVEEEARTRVKDRFVVSAPIAGFLRRISFDVADPIKQGQEVAEIDPARSGVLDPRSKAEAQAGVSASQAALDRAKENARAAEADAEYSHRRLVRMKELFDGGHVSRDDYDAADASTKKADAVRDSSEAAVKTAKADLDRAKSVLQYSGAAHAKGAGSVIVRSPAEGTVLKLHRKSESVVNAGEPLLDIGDPKNLEVKSEVLSAQAVRIEKGMRVRFERWGGPSELEGKVRVVEPAGFTKVSSLGVEEQRVLVIIDFTSPRSIWQNLGDAFRLDATFIIWEGNNVLQVPGSALFRKGDGWAVFMVENNRARLGDVKIGRRSDLAAEIISGVPEGAVVITHPDDSIREGVRVTLRKSNIP